MDKQIDVLTFGDLCVDMILSDSDIVPEFGQKEKLINNYSLEMGGSCSIFACQTAKLGLRTAIVGKVGEDEFGQLVLKVLRNAGVNTKYINSSTNYKTGVSVALNAGNDRAILTYNGTIDAVEAEDASDELLRNVRHLHIGSYFLMKKLQPNYPALIRRLKEYGATISLDTNWDPEENWDSGIKDILPFIDIFFPNENEAMAITRKNSAEEAINELKKIIPIVAVKRGSDGAVIYADGNTYYAQPLKTDVVDAVGAGDTFDGGFIYGYLTGKSIQDCGKIGCICGSLNTRQAGGVKGQPVLQELRSWIDL